VSKLYIFGDSYSTPGFCVDPRESWWGLMATDLSSKIQGVDNYSWPGNNIDSIQHIVVANQDMFDTDDYVVIGLPPIERLTVFEPDASPKSVIKFDRYLNQCSCSNVARHDGLAQTTLHQAGRDLVDSWNRSWQEAQILRQMITFTAWLDRIVDHYLVLNLSEPFQPLTQWTTLSSLQQPVMSHPCMMIFSDTYYSTNYEHIKPIDFETHGWFGHQGPAGNKAWYETSVRPRLRSLKWI
jgi:hypothetical protein